MNEKAKVRVLAIVAAVTGVVVIVAALAVPSSLLTFVRPGEGRGADGQPLAANRLVMHQDKAERGRGEDNATQLEKNPVAVVDVAGRDVVHTVHRPQSHQGNDLYSETMLDLKEFGTLAARVYEPSEAKSTAKGCLVIAFHGMAPELRWEWGHVAASLIEKPLRCRVVLPDFHSNASTKPQVFRTKSKSQRVALLGALIQAASVAPRATYSLVFMGKSWGGGVAADFTSTTFGTVDKLVLVAPASVRDLALVKIPTLLLWTVDDPVVPLARGEQLAKTCAPHCELHREPSGGHRVIDAYRKEIAAWLAS